MVGVSGAGTWPGTDVREAQSVVLGDLTGVPAGIDGLPFCVRLPARGPWADAVGTVAGLLVDLPAELGPHGWKLADRPGRDVDRARALLREDLDALAVAAYGYAGRLVVPVQGPLAVATQLYLARGDRVLADAGAVRELTESFAVGLAEHLASIGTAVPGAEAVVLLRETSLAEVLAGVVPSFSGRSPLRSVAAPLAAELLRTVVTAVRSAGATSVVIDVGRSWTVVGTAVSAGVDAVALDVATVDERGWDRLAETVEDGVTLWAAMPAAVASRSSSVGDRARPEGGGPDVVRQARALLDPWRALGLPAAGLADVVLLPEVPLLDGNEVGWSTPEAARTALSDVVRVALHVAEHAAG